MTDPIVRMFSTADDLAAAAAGDFAARAQAAVSERGRFAVALSGGSTPNRLFRVLAAEGGEAGGLDVPWDHVHVFWGDERFVPPDHPDSNFRSAQLELLSRVPIPEANVHRIRTEVQDADEAAAAYEAELVRFFALEAGHSPSFDLLFLGMGENGHTASLFPGTAALRESSRLVTAVWVEELGSRRITLTYPVINAAGRVVVMVTGAGKAATLARVLAGEGDPDELPILGVRPEHGRLYWFIDDAAASLWREKAGLARA